MLPSDKNGPDWKFEITGERTISMTGDAKICEMISSRLARGNEFKNITVNGKVIKGQAKEEGTQGAKKAKKQKTPKPDIQESDKYKENLETQIPEEYLNSSNNHSENTSEELPPEIEEQIVHESFQDTEEIKKKPVQTENFNEMNYGDNQENQLDLQSENLENNETQATGYFDFLSMQDQEENFFEIESQSPEEIEFEELGNQLYLDEMNGNNNAEANYRENLEKFAKGKSEKWKERARQEIEKSFAREKGQPETKISSKSKKETGKKEKSKKNDKNKGQAR